MLRMKKYKHFTITQVTENDVKQDGTGTYTVGEYLCFIPDDTVFYMHYEEWSAMSLNEIHDFIDSYESEVL